MGIHEELLRWAVEQGVELSGIKPQTIPNRGTGIIATRDIQVPHLSEHAVDFVPNFDRPEKPCS